LMIMKNFQLWRRSYMVKRTIKTRILWCVYDISYGLFGRTRMFPLVYAFPIIHNIITYFIDKHEQNKKTSLK